MFNDKIYTLINYLVIAVLVSFFVNVGITLAFFTDETGAQSPDMTFGTLGAEVSLNGGDFASSATVASVELVCGSPVVSEVKVKITGNTEGYIRVYVGYAGSSSSIDNATKATISALNMEEGVAGYDTYSQGSYRWVFYNGYYYLVNGTTDPGNVNYGKLLPVSASSNSGAGFMIFKDTIAQSTIYFPDLTKYHIQSSSTQDVIFEIQVQAVQRENLEATTPAELETLITTNDIFPEIEDEWHLLQFNTLGGAPIYSRLIATSEGNEVLPTVQGVDVYWYQNYTNGAYSTLIGQSGDLYARADITSNITLYAKYEYGKVAINFEGGDGYTGSLPIGRYITYDVDGGTESINVGSTLVRAGYTYEYWEIDEAVLRALNPGKSNAWINSHLRYTVSANAISVLKDIAPAGSVVTLHPAWSAIQYTATFDPNGGDLTSAYKALELANSDKVYAYDSVNGVYVYTYDITTTFTFPVAELQNSTFIGWLVYYIDTSNVKWRVDDSYVSGPIGAEYMGNVIFVAQWE